MAPPPAEEPPRPTATTGSNKGKGNPNPWPWEGDPQARRPPRREGAARRTKARGMQPPETSGDGHGPGAAPAAARPPEVIGGRDTETAATPRRPGRQEAGEGAIQPEMARSGPADPGSDPGSRRQVDVKGKLGDQEE
ncbi:basic salivary proline-rich protein 4-like [Panicum virgatum]|uniref:basic salivary proline-rich protein 4-like n=1 Tax=Panicum virgatum TaxID=38727 RepID=UPI0019D5918F|nr:basic salivary proline-rich protein 4-like [Panicum virgatum]